MARLVARADTPPISLARLSPMTRINPAPLTTSPTTQATIRLSPNLFRLFLGQRQRQIARRRVAYREWQHGVGAGAIRDQVHRETKRSRRREVSPDVHI